MRETTKSALRRSRDPAFVQQYFKGEGIDIGAGNDPLSAHAHLFPLVQRVVPWDRAQGDALYLPGVAEGSFDFVHSSHCLEHLANPFQGLARWLEVVRPGGYVVITVPDEVLYEKLQWPSRFNDDHKVSFTIYETTPALPASVNVLELVREMAPVAACERISLVRDHFDERRHSIDQTAHGAAECAIEIVLRKRAVAAFSQLRDALRRTRSCDEARAQCDELVQRYPYRFEAYHAAMMQLLRWDLAAHTLPLWEAAVRRLPGEHLPRLYQALNTIACGRLQEGFAQRERVMQPLGWQRRTTVQPPSDTPDWRGESLSGRSIVIWSEFGLGDEIFFLRFARILRERCGAASVSVVCQAPLVELFAASGEADAVYSVDQAAALPAHDYWVFPHAIAAHLPLQLNALPLSVPYLRRPDSIAQTMLPAPEGWLKVGVAFKGAPTHENDRQRSLPSLSVLDDLFALDRVAFFSLQKGAGADEAAAYAASRSNFHDLGACLCSMGETAGAIEALDLVLTVDTSVANLAGAMGKPTWLMVPFYGDWRWHYGRDDSPWYPSVRVHRRRAGADWSEVVARLRGHLQAMVASGANHEMGGA